MQDFGTKADNSPPPGGQLSAAEFNNLATENENAVLRSGQTLSGAAVDQLAQSLFLHAVKARSFQDSGAANAYVATPVSGTSGVLLPTAYTNLDGAVISFKAANTNSGAATLNIGQTTGTLLGTKPIRTPLDTALPANAILAGQYIDVTYNAAFNGGVGAWVLWAAAAIRTVKRQLFAANGTYTPSPGMVYCDVEAVAAGGGGGGAAGGSGTSAAAGGGGYGGYSKKLFTTAQIGASQAVAIGTAGTGGVAGNNAGGTGGNTTFGALLTCNGGAGGSGSAALTTAGIPAAGGAGGTASGGDINIRGSNGFAGFILGAANGGLSGQGGSGAFGAGGYPSGPNGAGNSGNGNGSGGSGGAANTAGNASGAPGSPGGLFIVEYCTI